MSSPGDAVAGPADPASPCLSICTLDASGTLCTGCYRTIDEIALWSRLDPAQKRAVLAQLPVRRAFAATSPAR